MATTSRPLDGPLPDYYQYSRFRTHERLAEEKEYLCWPCATIDFQKALSLQGAELGRWGVAITKPRTDIQPGCKLCDYIAWRLKDKETTGTQYYKYHLRAIGSFCALKLQPTQDQRQQADVLIAIIDLRIPDTPLHTACMKAIDGGLLAPLHRHIPGQKKSKLYYRGRLVEPYLKDYGPLKACINRCRNKKSDIHTSCRRSALKSKHDITRVINCETREIVRLTPDMEYIALSYVWGSPAGEDKGFRREGDRTFLSDDSPKTIEDAIKIVQGLEETYLWVDRYCIWESENTHLQVQNMHTIYQDAIVTIVPSNAEKAEAGFSGISIPRIAQFNVSTNAGTLVSTCAHLTHQLWWSKWLTRGWTYQEAFLSRRCLFFTREQVYFVCKSHLRSEAVEQGEDYDWEVMGPNLLTKTPQPHFNRKPGTTRQGIQKHIAEYSSRSLTFDSDALDAFLGVTAFLNQTTLWGISGTYPRRNLEHCDLNFARNLSWRRSYPLPDEATPRRRIGFPSWSWASLVAKVGFSEDNLFEPADAASFSAESATTGKTQAISQLINSKKLLVDAQQELPECGKVLSISGRAVEVSLQHDVPEFRYKVYAPTAHGPSKGGQASMSKKSVAMCAMAIIDGDDEAVLSKLEMQNWTAVELFKVKRAFNKLQAVWMLVDSPGTDGRSPRRRIGMIQEIGWYEHMAEKPMDWLKPKVRAIIKVD